MNCLICSDHPGGVRFLESGVNFIGFVFRTFRSKNFDTVSRLKYLLKIIREQFQIQHTLILFCDGIHGKVDWDWNFIKKNYV